MGNLDSIPSRPWARMLGAHRDALERLRLECDSLRSSMLFSASPGGFYARHWAKMLIHPTPHPGRTGLVTGLGYSGTAIDETSGRSIASLIWADEPLRVAPRAKECFSKHERQAVSTLCELAKTIPRDDLCSMLPAVLRPVALRHANRPVSWLALLHALAWDGQVPGLDATRWTWEEPTSKEARAAAKTCTWDDQRRALIADGMPGWWATIDADEHPDADWVSELKTPIVPASLLVLRWFEMDHNTSGKRESGGGMRTGKWFSNITGQSLKAEALRKAAERGKLKMSIRPDHESDHEWRHSVDEVANRWPNYAEKIKEKAGHEADTGGHGRTA